MAAADGSAQSAGLDLSIAVIHIVPCNEMNGLCVRAPLIRAAIMMAFVGAPAYAAAQCPTPQTPLRRAVFHPDEATSAPTTIPSSERRVIEVGSTPEGDVP